MFKEEKNEIPELKLGVNLLREESKVYRLPLLRADGYHIQDGDTVELILLDIYNISVETWERPLRFGKYFGNRIFFNTMYDGFCINPKFVFDGVKKVWTLMNAGYVCFAEMELEYKKNHKLYGGQDA